MARPQKTVKDQRSQLLQVKLTPSEKQAMQAAAEMDDRPLSAWARVQLLKAAGVKANGS